MLDIMYTSKSRVHLAVFSSGAKEMSSIQQRECIPVNLWSGQVMRYWLLPVTHRCTTWSSREPWIHFTPTRTSKQNTPYPSLVEGWCLRPQTPESSQDTGLSLAGVPQLHAYTGESTGASAESSSDAPHPPSEIKWQLDQRLWHSSVPCSLAVGKRSLGCPCFDLSNYW